ncbi:ABC transporter permease [Microlunatus parietis]|uniref:Peptide/nickel transport system permease protein n=1 Tax=Microlunatus parietis TaxID=682979 RepID=A0A7Y9IDA3_9ACTN|nr:ABC transporter permease [Microlunatus parietis]NYE74712.1 peptide/nickel transport system permease protein [Microlunatus parietis]
MTLRQAQGTVWRQVRSMTAWTRVCAGVLIIVVGAALLAGVVSPFDPDRTVLTSRNALPIFLDPTSAHLLGADGIGRDTLSRTLHGTRTSLLIAAVGLIVGSLVGLTLGLTAGFFGGVWDRLVMLAVNFQQSVPLTLLILVGLVMFGRGIGVLMIFIGLARWETYARVIRGLVLSAREQPFVDAARSYGAPPVRIILRHVLPNTVSYYIVLMVLSFPPVMLLESALSFIGIGVQPPTATLGQMIGEGRTYLATNPWSSMVPSAVLVLMAYCVHVIGEWLRSRVQVRFADR